MSASSSSACGSDGGGASFVHKSEVISVHQIVVNNERAVTNKDAIKRFLKEATTWDNPEYKDLKLKLNDYGSGCQSATGVIHSEIHGPLEVVIYLTDSYPFVPLRLCLKKKIQHPYVHRSTNEICWSILRKEWSPSINIATLLLSMPHDIIDKASTESTMACSLATNTHNQDCVYRVKQHNSFTPWDELVEYVPAEYISTTSSDPQTSFRNWYDSRLSK